VFDEKDWLTFDVIYICFSLSQILR